MIKIFLPQIKKYYKSSFWPIMEFLSSPLIMVIALPVFIKYLGSEQYGIWILINSIAIFISVLNVGFGDTNIKFISKYRALNDIEGVRKIAANIYSLSVFALFISIFIGLILSFIFRFYNFFNVSLSLYPVFLRSIIVGFIIFGFRLVEQSFLSVFKGFERYDLSSKIAIISKNVPLIVNIALAFVFKSIFPILVFTAFLVFIALIFEYYLLIKKFVKIDIVPRINTEVLKEIYGFSIFSWLQGILSLVSSQIDKFIIMKLTGAEILTYYFIGQTIAGQIHGFLSSGISFVFPIISKKSELKHNLNQIYSKLQFIVITVGMFLVTTVFISRNFILPLWLGEKTYIHSKEIIEIFLLGEMFLMWTVVPFYVLNAGGYIKINTFFMIVTLITQIIFLPIFFHFFNVIGLALAKNLSLLIGSTTALFYISKIVFKENYTISVLSSFIVGICFVTLYFKNYLNSELIVLWMILILLINYFEISRSYEYKNNLGN